MSGCRSPRFRSLYGLLLAASGILLVAGGGQPTLESLPEPEATARGLQAIVQRHTRAAVDEVAAYLRDHPQAGDAEAAYAWLFETALKQALEPVAAPLARQYGERESATPETLQLARQVAAVAAVGDGRIEDALILFDDHLKTIRLRSANEALGFAARLASELQLTHDFAAARAVYERLSERFFLNAAVREFCENKMHKLGFLGEAVPAVSLADLDGKPIDWADYRGKVVLVDFWATNCPPCLDEFPSLKQLYAATRDRGFAVVGLSLDEDSAAIEEFQKGWELPWRLALADADGMETRERFHVKTIPSTFLLDKSGRIAAVDLKGHALRRAVEELLDEAPVEAK